MKILLKKAQIKSWTVSHALWSKIQPLVPARNRPRGRTYQRKPGAGRKPMPARQLFSAIVYVLRTGCQWKALPKEYSSASAVHAHFQRWQREGFFLKIWKAGLAKYDEMEGIAWRWQSIDGAMGTSGAGMYWAQPHGSGERTGASAAFWSTHVESRCRSSSAGLHA